MNRHCKVKECKHLFFVGISLILCAVPLPASQIEISDLKKFENRYIVIVGTLDSFEEAIKKKMSNSLIVLLFFQHIIAGLIRGGISLSKMALNQEKGH